MILVLVAIAESGVYAAVVYLLASLNATFGAATSTALESESEILVPTGGSASSCILMLEGYDAVDEEEL